MPGTNPPTPPPTTTSTSFGFTLVIGSDPKTQVMIPLSATLPAPTSGEKHYEYTNQAMKWTDPVKHIPNTQDPASKPSAFTLPVGAFLAWAGTTLSGGALSATDLPPSLQNLKVGVDYLLLDQTSTPKHTVVQLSVTLLQSDAKGDTFATFTPIDGLSLSASSPYLSVAIDKTG